MKCHSTRFCVVVTSLEYTMRSPRNVNDTVSINKIIKYLDSLIKSHKVPGIRFLSHYKPLLSCFSLWKRNFENGDVFKLIPTYDSNKLYYNRVSWRTIAICT